MKQRFLWQCAACSGCWAACSGCWAAGLLLASLCACAPSRSPAQPAPTPPNSPDALAKCYASDAGNP